MSIHKKMTAIADAIRSKTGKTEKLALDDMALGVDEACEAKEATLIDGSATDIQNSLVTNISKYMFSDRQGLISASFPMATTIGSYAFSGCESLSKFSAPNVKTLGTGSFLNCVSLKSVYFPELTNASWETFSCCTGLSSLHLPKLTHIHDLMFHRNEWLRIADFSSLQTIDGVFAFERCDRLEVLIIRTPTMCELLTDEAFYGSGIEDGIGYIYVPANLIDQYKAATNWCIYASRFRAIEDYPDICGGETV